MDDEIIEFDKLKTKIIKYVMYKKRTEAEVRQKFSQSTGNLLENVIEYLKENDYINDVRYVERFVQEVKVLKNLSIKEIEYKLMQKGIDRKTISEYIEANYEKLLEYEANSAKNLYNKKLTLISEDETIEYLRKKGYKSDTIKNLQMEE